MAFKLLNSAASICPVPMSTICAATLPNPTSIMDATTIAIIVFHCKAPY
jgi:hypothetical protein